LADGSYTATINARDRAGNSASTTFSFIVDTHPPTVLFPNPNDDVATLTPPITIQVADLGPASLNNPSMSLDGGSPSGTYDSGTRVLSYTPTALTPGKHHVVATGIDSAGNSASLGWDFWVLQTLTYDILSGSYLPTTCPNAGLSLLSLQRGQAVTVEQIKHRTQQTPTVDLAGRYLSQTPVTFSWTPTLDGAYTFETIADGVPWDTSRLPVGVVGAASHAALFPMSIRARSFKPQVQLTAWERLDPVADHQMAACLPAEPIHGEPKARPMFSQALPID
jgi:hypothetical protein